MAFALKLSPETRARVARLRSETLRIFALDNLELGRELMQLVRTARQERPEMTADRQVYDSEFLWFVAPELARRLGFNELLDTEVDTDLHTQSVEEFRQHVGCFLHNMSPYCRGDAWQFLTREACNGNPVVIALDRLCPGRLDDKDDAIVQSVASIARHRGTTYAGVWTPAVLMQD